MTTIFAILRLLALILGSLCTGAAILVGLCAIPAVILGPEDEDPEDELRVHECEQMAQGLRVDMEA